MALIRSSSPHLHNAGSTPKIMRLLLIAALPGIAAMTFFFGWGTLIQIGWAMLLALGFEAAVMKLRRRPVAFYLRDSSALVTALLLGLALPPFSPWWLTLVGVFVAIVIAKHLYGGLGNNPFNPAMVAYALLLVSFPVDMTRWTAPFVLHADDGWQVLGLIDTFKVIFGALDHSAIDAFTSATPLDELRHRGGLTTEEAFRESRVLADGVGAWHAVAAAYFMGGVFLLYRKVFTWHTPLAMLGSLAAISTLFYLFAPDNFADPFFHLTMGATMLGAFFIATDPVTAATSNRGKLYYGAGIGVLVYVIRTWGSYPDAVAFAVLLMNLAAPFIDQYTQPRTYGHAKPKRGLKEDA
ncbi:electron transport complex subunit D [Marinobacterium nitratireducens]|uniref:Ion-translocating oxidoreductase complex subunit D n=1 Tax=Marinobacterium nitratireducens TaxID=518897 RepID=A0A917ZI13_9GAMM|nr:electron transport complex subunit RsxD [Marinobacterium nitratireducens]GGO83168.1 electron transport complex subunit D [Marinobacterium nitratireducens]